MYRSTISSIVLRFEDVFIFLATKKIVVWSFSIVLRWKGASDVDLELMRHRTTILGIVVRFVRDLIFSYKSQTDFWGKGGKILEKEIDFWSRRSGEKVGDHQNSYPVTNFM